MNSADPTITARARSTLGKWASAGAALIIAALLGRFGDRIFSVIWPEGAKTQIHCTQKWEVFNRVYWVGGQLPSGQTGGSLTPIGAEPIYRHTISLRNDGSESARNLRVELSGLSESHSVDVEPAMLRAEVLRLQPTARLGDLSQSPVTLVSMKSLPPHSEAVVRILFSLTNASAPLTSAERVMADNAPAQSVSFDRDAEGKAVAQDSVWAYGQFPAPDWAKWKAAKIQATVELHPNP